MAKENNNETGNKKNENPVVSTESLSKDSAEVQTSETKKPTADFQAKETGEPKKDSAEVQTSETKKPTANFQARETRKPTAAFRTDVERKFNKKPFQRYSSNRYRSKQNPFFKKKVCKFCIGQYEQISYKDVNILRRFVSDRGKILPRRVTGTCAKHQRRLANAVKRARILALLTFV